MPKLTFRGGAGTVTGSCFLLETEQLRLLVDCGLFQGNRELRLLNYRSPLVPLNTIDYILLTHAHIDHSGLIPRFYKDGFRGKILATPATVSLCKIMLPDSGHIQEIESEWQSRKARRRGEKPVPPLYTAVDAINCLECFQAVPYEQETRLNDQVRVRFLDAGHILGSAIIEVWIRENGEETKIVFSGDLGNTGSAIIRDPTPVAEADYLLLESTYGNRLHEPITDQSARLREIILETTRNGGNVIIPAFAVGRTQEILYALNGMVERREIPPVPVFIDSPLAVSATEVFRECRECFDQETLELLQKGDDPLHFPSLTLVRSTEESRALNNYKGGAVIISASGMCDAGRIKHHLKHNLWRPECAVIFVGFQATGTLGRRILDGAKKVKILGEDINVAARVYSLPGFSAHADQQGLLNWVTGFTRQPRHIFVVHGEPEESAALAELIGRQTGIPTSIPQFGEEYLIQPTRHGLIGVSEPLAALMAGKRQRLLEAIDRLEKKLSALKEELLTAECEDKELQELELAVQEMEERITLPL
jgi:metallo-beta-lactamase family protein